MNNWLGDFEWRDGKIRVRETGAELTINFALIKEIAGWFPFYTLVKLKNLALAFTKRPNTKIAFLPSPARPWYLLPFLINAARFRRVKSPENADVLIYFEDQTLAASPQYPPDFTGKTMNFACINISKSHVSEVFKQVFGYGIAVDPLSYTGLIAVKSEKNGAHDGFTVQGPIHKNDYNPNLVYQKLIDNKIDENLVEDLRCPTVGGEIGLIFVKHRPSQNRFANFNSRVLLARPEDHLSATERDNLRKFAKVMRLDFGGMDVLRDRADGRIYVVDVNKTDMGPPIALPLKDKFRATNILISQLKAFFDV